MRVRLPILLTAALLTISTATACTKNGDPRDGSVTVVTALYPLEFVTEQVGGAKVTVTNLVQPGVEPHDLELSPRQVARLTEADLLVYLRRFQPDVDGAAINRAPDKTLDAGRVANLRDGHTPMEDGKARDDERGTDPHFWLDPTRLAAVADAVGAALATLDPGGAATYRQNASALRQRLEALDREYRQGLASCRQNTFVVSHNAFGYLAERYHLVQVPITGLTPEAEPTAGRLAEITRLARQKHITVIFFEKLVDPRVARTLATEIGARTDVLDPIEGIDRESTADYFSLMRDNLRALRSALDCS